MAECIDIQADLSAYLDGELPAQDRSALDAHLRACDACRRVLEDLRGVSTVVAELPRAKAPASLIEKLRKDIANEPQLREQAKAAVSFTSAPRAGIRPRVHWVPFAMGAAALVLLCVLAFLVLPAMSKTHPEAEVAIDTAKTAAPLPAVTPPAAKAEQQKDGDVLRLEDESKWKDKQAAPERSLKKMDGKAAPSDEAATGRLEPQKERIDALARDRSDKPNELAKSADELRSRGLAKSDESRPVEKAAAAAIPPAAAAGGRADGAAGKGSQQGNFGAQANGATAGNAERDAGAKRRMSADKAVKEPTGDAKGESLAGVENRAKREENTYRGNDPARAATLQNKDDAVRKITAGEEAPRLEGARNEKKELSDAKSLKETQQAEQLDKSVRQQQLEPKAAENRKEIGAALEGKDQNAAPAREQEKSVATKKPSDPGDGRGAGIAGGGGGNPPKPETKAATIAAAPAAAVPPAPPGAALAKPAGTAISKTLVFRTKDPQRLSQELKALVEASGARWEDVAAKGKSDAPAEKLTEAKPFAGQGGAKGENYQIVASANQRDVLLAKLQQFEALQRQDDRIGATGADKKAQAEGGDKFKNAPAQEAAELEESKKKSKAEPEAPRPNAPAKKAAAPLPDADQLHEGAEVRIQILIIAE